MSQLGGDSIETNINDQNAINDSTIIKLNTMQWEGTVSTILVVNDS